MIHPWDQIENEARDAFVGPGNFPLRAYSELMPPPYVGIKPYAPVRSRAASTFGVSEPSSLDIDEYEQAFDLEPGLAGIARHLLDELGKLVRGTPHGLSRTLLEDNPAWPTSLSEAARAGKLAHHPLLLICPIALSRSQDDKGNSRWTLFGASHVGPAAPFFHGLDEARLSALLKWAKIPGEFRVLGDDVPRALHARKFESLDDVRTLVTFVPFAKLPSEVQAAYLGGKLTLVPNPASLVLFEHPRYLQLASELPRATQIPLLHLFPRVETAYAIRIPQSGWLDESDAASGHASHGHRVVSHLVRTHRWQRVARDADVHGDGKYTDKVTVALFSTTPEAVDLYDKPIARNAQVWTEDYRLLLDGLHATPAQLRHAAGVADAGGRFGYRMYYPPMRAGRRELFWHVPIIALEGKGPFPDAPLGYVSAELEGKPSLTLEPRMLARPDHVAAARLFARDPGRARHSTTHNVRKLLETHELLGEPLSPSLARSLIHVSKQTTLDQWFDELGVTGANDVADASGDRKRGKRLLASLRACIGDERDPGPPRVLGELGTRAFEEQVWSTIAHLAHGKFRMKNDADAILVNRGKHGGKAAKAAHVAVHQQRDLEALGDHLHERYRALIAKFGIGEVVDHVFRWETDFSFDWMGGWNENQQRPAERNIVMMIPGRNRGEAVVMGDHYDTAYMEDVYYPESGGDYLRAAACGADDNHSATTALLLAAERLLPLARDGKLARDVWLIHLTGEEYPADCLGARALCQALVERRLAFIAEDGSARDVSKVDVVAAFVLDMIGHNTERDRDVFMIAPGEGKHSARLAEVAQRANQRWNRCAKEWNEKRPGLHRAQRMPDGREPHVRCPPPFAHLPLHGEVRVEWEPRSALFNTDGQIFSDVGIPAVLFMENYDISRKGYHDTHDTMENIDLDYCAAMTAIAIETVAEVACADSG